MIPGSVVRATSSASSALAAETATEKRSSSEKTISIRN
jgi:hypothetical protein